MLDKQRLRFSLKLASIHLFVSLAIAALAAGLIWLGWYSYPHAPLLGVSNLYKLIIVVDVICGPLLTMILANPSKSKKETSIDITLVGTIQVLALAYGLYSLYIARPVAVVFERDRHVVVTANEVIGKDHFPFIGFKYVGISPPQNTEERLSLLDFSLKGGNTAALASWWVPYNESLDTIKTKSKSLATLLKARPQHTQEIQYIALKHKLSINELRYLPYVSSKNLNWISILNKEGETLDYANIDGFI